MKSVTKIGKVSNNISILASRIKKNPNDSFSKFALALELINIEENKKALALFRSIMDNDPDYVGVYYHLGKMYEKLEENKLAIETYKSGITIAEKLKDLHSKAELQGALTNLELESEDDW